MTLPRTMPQASETSIRYSGWRVVAVCFLMATFAWAFGFYGQGVYLAELQRIHGWPSSLISTATTMFYLFGALLLVFLSEAMRWAGPRACLLFGVVCMALATAALGWITTPMQLYLVYALMALGWAGTSLGAINNTLGLWFDTRRGMAISLALNGASVGGVIGVPLLIAAIGSFGFSTALPWAAVVMVVVMVPAILIGIGHPPQRTAVANAAGMGPTLAAPSALWIRADAFRTLAFWTITVSFSLVLLAQVGFIVHQISYLDPIIGRERAAVAVALMTAMAVIGRVLFGFFIDRLNQRKASAMLFVSQALALLVAINTTSEVALFAASAVFGFTVGNAITLPALIVQREFDPRSFGVLISLVTAISQVTYAFGPGLIGLMRDLSGSYALPFYVCAGLELAAAAVVLIGSKAREAPP